VRLFGDEQIQADLFLTVSQWPALHGTLLIHGYRYLHPSQVHKFQQDH